MVKVFALLLVLSVKGTNPIPLGGRIYEDKQECLTTAKLVEISKRSNNPNKITAYCVERELPANWREGATYQGKMP